MGKREAALGATADLREFTRQVELALILDRKLSQ
jgi:hypothetical protein